MAASAQFYKPPQDKQIERQASFVSKRLALDLNDLTVEDAMKIVNACRVALAQKIPLLTSDRDILLQSAEFRSSVSIASRELPIRYFTRGEQELWMLGEDHILEPEAVKKVLPLLDYFPVTLSEGTISRGSGMKSLTEFSRARALCDFAGPVHFLNWRSQVLQHRFLNISLESAEDVNFLLSDKNVFHRLIDRILGSDFWCSVLLRSGKWERLLPKSYRTDDYWGLTVRDKKMADSIERIFIEYPNIQSTAFAVGAMHLPGISQNLIELGFEERTREFDGIIEPPTRYNECWTSNRKGPSRPWLPRKQVSAF